MSERREVFCQICDKKLVASPNVCIKVLENPCFCSKNLGDCAECEMYDFICSHCYELTHSDRKELEYLIEERATLQKRVAYIDRKILGVRVKRTGGR